MTIAIITDLHADESFTLDNGADPWTNWNTILKEVKNRNVDQVIFLGDIGSAEAVEPFVNSLNHSGFDYRLVLGNHDRFDTVIAHHHPAFIKEQKEWYWSEESENHKSIFLDTSSNAISQTQLDWLRSELQTDLDILLFIHHPVLETGTTPQLEFPLEGVEQLKDILINSDRKIHIFCGHLHLDDVQNEGKITQTVTPSSSVQIKRQSEKAEIEGNDFAWRLLEIEGDRIKTELFWYDVEQQRIQ